MTGFWFIDRADEYEQAAPDELFDFLGRKQAPLCFGFGSMTMPNPEYLTYYIVEALKKTHQGGIILSGWGNVGKIVNIKDSLRVFAMSDVPHDWLLPQVKAMVHHGGAGTTAAVLRAGIPSIVVPFFAAQPVWGEMLMRLGVSPKPIPYNEISEKTLFYQQCLKIASETEDETGKAKFLAKIGNIYQCIGEQEKAIQVYQQWWETAIKIGDSDAQAKALSGLGNAYQCLEQPQKALGYYQQWLRITRTIGDPIGEGIALGSLGSNYELLGDFKGAIHCYEHWLEVARTIGDRHWEGIALGSLGKSYESLSQYPKAIEFYQMWLESARLIGDWKSEGICLSGMANVYECWGQYQKAIHCYQESLKVRIKIDDDCGEANIWFHLAVVLEKINQVSSALKAYDNARKLYQEIGFDQGIQHCNDAIELLAPSFVFWRGISKMWQAIKSWF